MMSTVFDRFGCFGKLPLSREFIVDGQAQLAASGFDAWIAEALGLAAMQMGPRYRSLAVQFTPIRFSWAGRNRSETELAGILYPSRDGAGRIHPFVPLAWLNADECSGRTLEHALQLNPLFDVLEQMTDRCRRASDPSFVLDTVRNERTTWDLDGATKCSEIRRFFAESSVNEFRSRFGTEAPDLVQIVQALVESVTYLRGRDPKEVRLGVRIPLALTGNAAGAEVALWSELIRVLFRAEIPGACLFWTNEATSPNSAESPASPVAPPTDSGEATRPIAHLHFFFSTPSAAQWSGIIDADSELETISYLERPYGGPPAERMDPTLREALENGETTLARWLEAAASV